MRRPPHTPVPDNDAIETAAADWLARRDRGLSPEEAEQFAAWEAADARHTAELTRLDATWRLLDTADEVPDIMQLAHEMEATEKRPTARRRWRPWALAAAGLGVAAVLAMTWTAFLRAPWLLETAGRAPAAAAGNRSYHVVPGAAQRLTLADGTLVELNADSAVNTAFSATERTVQVLRGEAHFAVVKDAVRPFVVHAGNVTVRAVGTAFNVRIDSTAVEVLVTEGRVRVDDAARGESLLAPATATASPPLAAPATLSAGQRVVVSAEEPTPASPITATPADIERLLAWRSPQLVFERTSLEDAVAAFNSFNRCQLVLGDPALRTRRLGGTFRADNLEAFVRLLEKGFNIVADTSDGRAIVLHAAAARQKD
jgi:transmembrane sensor